MASVAGRKCPECGREQAKEGLFFRTRRRWWRAAFAVGMIGAGVAMGGWSAVESGRWRRWLPDAAVVRLAPTRAREGGTDPATGKLWTSPWAEELARRAPGLSGADYLTALRTAGVLTLEEPVREGRAMVVGLRVPWRWMGSAEIEMTPRAKGLAQVKAGDVNERKGCGNPRIARMQREMRQLVGVVPVGAKVVEFEVRIRTRVARERRGLIDRGYDVATRELGVWRVEVEPS